MIEAEKEVLGEIRVLGLRGSYEAIFEAEGEVETSKARNYTVVHLGNYLQDQDQDCSSRKKKMRPNGFY